MTTPDISQLNLNAPDQIEWNEYQDAGTPQPPPPAGTYTGVAPDSFEFTATQAGYLMVTIDPIKIVGPTNSGDEVRFSKASVKKYANRNGSPAADYLRACGVSSQPRTNEEYVSLIESTAGRPFSFDLDWEAYDKEDGYSIEGYENFPDDGKGGKLFFIKNPTSGKALRARARVRRFKSAVA